MKFAKILTLAIALGAAVALSGCSGRYNAAGGNYELKVYSGDGTAAVYQVNGYTTRSVGLIGIYPDGRKVIASGTYVLRRTDAGAANNDNRPSQYRASLFSGGKEVETIDAYAFYSDDNRIFLRRSGTERSVISGNYVIRNLGANTEGMPASARFKVGLLCDGVTVGTWYADNYRGVDASISLRINGIKDALLVGGNFTVEQIRQ